MKDWIIKVFISTLAVLISAYLLEGVEVENFLAALVFAAILSFLNLFLKPVLVILTIPITIFSLGIFLLVINALVILIADYLSPQVYISNFWWALLFSFILSFVTSLLESFFGTKKVVNGGENE